MDYIGLFGNLNTNNRYSRKSPHKAMLLLTVIEMYEKGLLSDNVIRYDEELKKQFVSVWSKFLNDETEFQPSAYLPYWYMQSESFWHIVPKRGKEDIISLFRDSHVKPSESKLYDCVDYAELDDDLYFLMTIPSGRSSLKRVLLESYTKFSEHDIDLLSRSDGSYTDCSEIAQIEYEKILREQKSLTVNTMFQKTELKRTFDELDVDLRILLNLVYYKYLWEQQRNRSVLLGICPTIYDLYDRIVNNPIKNEDISPSDSLVYESFLTDLKIALMGEDNTMNIIERIEESLEILKGEDFNNPNTNPIAEDIVEKDYNYYTSTVDVSNEEETLCGTIPDDEYGNEIRQFGITIENTLVRCSIINKFGERIFSADGKIKIFNGKLYRFNYKEMCLTVKDIIKEGDLWLRGDKKIVAYKGSEAYDILDSVDYIDKIEDLIERPNWEDNRILISGKWYNYRGYPLDDVSVENNKDELYNHVKEDNVNNSYESKNWSSDVVIDRGSKKKFRWGLAKRSEAKSYYQQGMSISQLAALFDCSEEDVTNVLKKMKLL